MPYKILEGMMLPILTQDVWRDEAFSLLISLKPLDEIIKLTARDTNPPFYYLLLHAFMALFGDGQVPARLLSFLFHFLLSVSVFFLAGKLLKNRFWSLLSAVVVFFNPFLLIYAFEIRAYNLFALLSVAAFFFFINKWPFLFSLTATLMIFTHNYGVFILVAFVFIWFTERRGRNWLADLRSFSTHFFLPFLGLLIWIPVLLGQLKAVTGDFWIKAGFVSAEIISLWLKKFWAEPLSLFPFLILASFFSLSSYLWLKNWAIISEEKRALISLILAPILPALAASAVGRPILQSRYLIPIVPLTSVFLIWPLSLNSSGKFPVRLLTVLSLLAFFLPVDWRLINQATKAPVESSVFRVLSQASARDIILSESNLNFLEVKYYARRLNSPVPVRTYSPDGRVAFYLGSVLYEESEILREIPETTVWLIKGNGTFQKLK